MLGCQTERMTVRELRPEDRAEFIRVHEVSRDHLGPWLDDASLEDRVERVFSGLGSGTGDGRHVRFVGESSDSRIVGFFNLVEIVRGVFDSAYAAWYVNVEFNGRGYGTEGVRAILDLAFSNSNGLGLHRVQANIIPENLASVGLAEKVGFRKEGLAERYLRIAGKWQDHVMYARTVEEHRFRYLDEDSAS